METLGEIISHPVFIGLSSAAAVILVFYFEKMIALFRYIFGIGQSEPNIEVNVHVPRQIQEDSEGTITLTIEGYERRVAAQPVPPEFTEELKRSREELEKMRHARDAEKQRANRLESELKDKDLEFIKMQIGEIDRRLRNPASSYLERKERMNEIQKILHQTKEETRNYEVKNADDLLKGGDLSGADTVFSEALAEPESKDEHAAQAAFGRGIIAEEEIRWSDAANHYKHAADLTPDARRLGKAAEFLRRVWRMTEAEHYKRERIRILSPSFADDPQLEGTELSNLSSILRENGKDQEAEVAIQRSIELAKPENGGSLYLFAKRMHGYASFLAERNRVPEARTAFQSSLAAFAKAPNKKQKPHVEAQIDWANFQHYHGNVAEAYRIAKGLYDGVTEQQRKQDPDLIGTMANTLAHIEWRLSHWNDASVHFDDALQLNTAAFGPNGHRTKQVADSREIFRSQWKGAQRRGD